MVGPLVVVDKERGRVCRGSCVEVLSPVAVDAGGVVALDGADEVFHDAAESFDAGPVMHEVSEAGGVGVGVVDDGVPAGDVDVASGWPLR